MKWAYFCVGNMLVSGLAILACTVAFREHTVTHVRLAKITNATYPDQIAPHFGKPLQSFNPNQIGLPGDGYCEDYSNQVSWRVLVCFGTQPESQP